MNPCFQKEGILNRMNLWREIFTQKKNTNKNLIRFTCQTPSPRPTAWQYTSLKKNNDKRNSFNGFFSRASGTPCPAHQPPKEKSQRSVVFVGCKLPYGVGPLHVALMSRIFTFTFSLYFKFPPHLLMKII